MTEHEQAPMMGRDVDESCVTGDVDPQLRATAGLASMPRSVAWTGRQVHLRRFRRDDAAVYHAWNGDDEQTRNLDQVPWPSDVAAVTRWAEAEAERVPDGDNIRLVIADLDDVAVGDITIHDADPRTGTFSWGVSIRPDVRGRGYANEALTLVLRYFFHERRYQKANAGIFAFNASSVRLHERLGFQLEGRQRRMTYTGGEYHDLLLYGLTREEFDDGVGASGR